MKRTFQKSTAILLALVQLFLLCPVFMPAAMAVETESETPALNGTIVGTVKFQSFNFLGDNKTGDDGVDYESTFYYTDDYFSHSAVNEAVNQTSVPWTQLDDVSLAACSMDFAVASYTTNAGNILQKGGKSYANTNYAGKYINAKNFLEACGFQDFESVNYEVAPTADSIAYCIAHKDIYIWDEATQQNRTFRLVAVGIRGAGYGAEWANNVTIGTPGNGANVVRHVGFDESAKTVCSGVEQYIKKYGISENVKYWVSGFSRAAAVANLTAGYLTDNKSVYHAEKRDIYGYTWECPQAASTSENALNYKNIHNIINAMDAVPKVSPSSFNHQRLGVDYVMPYYGNTTSTDNTTYYTRMRGVLQSIAVGTTIDGEYQEDPLIAATHPSTYPYNRPVTIYKMSAGKLVTDAIGGNLMTEFGTAEANTNGGLINNGKVSHVLGDDNNDGKPDWYMDRLIDELVQVILTSSAFDRGYNSTTNVITHRTRFINNYQTHLRTLFAYFLDFSGPAFLGLVDQLMEKITNQLKLSNAGFALAFTNFYNNPTDRYTNSWLNPAYYLIDSSWRGQLYKDVLIMEAKGVAQDVADDLTSGYNHPTITRETMHAAMDKAVELVVDLYADELDRYESQYFGTFLRQLNVILSTHEQETVLSWIMSVDPNHINRSCRTLTVPLSADVTLYEFREKYGEVSTDGETTAPIVATLQNGEFTLSKDQRITRTISGSSVIIRYPASLDIRADVKANQAFSLSAVSARDVQTMTAYEKVSAGAAQFSDGLPSGSYSNVTATAKTNVTATNTALRNYGTVEAGDTLHVRVNDLATYNSDGEKSTYVLSVDKAPVTTVADYASNVGLTSATSIDRAAVLSGTRQETAEITGKTIPTRQQQTVVPASSIYYDDDLNGQTFTSDGHGYSANINDDAVSKNASAVSGSLFFTFYGTGIDIYCTTHSAGGIASAALYAGSDTTGTRLQTISVKNQSDGDYYNTPTIRFTGLKQDTYTVWLYANEAAQYKLDGVRVYDPVQKGTAAADAQAAAGEGNVLYLNLHDLLLNAEQGFSVNPVTGMSDDFDKSAISGVLFVDNVDAIVTESHYDADGVWHEAMTQLYATQFEAYKANSPKNEIYLSGQQAITFQVNTAKAAPGSTIYIGMSAPETGNGSVSITGSGTKSVTSVMDMYYGITVPSNGSITITNTGTSLISLTNLKIPNVADADTITALPAAERKSAMRAFFAPVTTETIELAAAQPEETAVPEETSAPVETPEPESTPELSSLVQQLLSSFVSSLFGSISRLFS